MASKTKLTGQHIYAEFKEETVRKRLRIMLELRDKVDVYNAHVKFSYGNRKTGNLVPSVSLIPIVDCGANCACCAKGCYALRNICCYDQSRAAFANNSAIARRDPEKFFREVDGELKKNKWFRFFASGDIIDEGFFEEMVHVTEINPHCQVLVFTKQFHIVNKWIAYNGPLPENLHIIFSEWRGMTIDNPYNLPTSRPVWKGEQVPSGIWCGGLCSECACTNSGCWCVKKGERILFEAH
jgi:hypothetical protein